MNYKIEFAFIRPVFNINKGNIKSIYPFLISDSSLIAIRCITTYHSISSTLTLLSEY